jgi:ankyrin repeat protein
MAAKLRSRRSKRTTRSKRHRGGSKEADLIAASLSGRTEIVKRLLEKGADVTAENDAGWTALHQASDKGHTEIVAMLLEKGADVNAKNDYGYTALQSASREGHTKIVKMLLKKGADVNAKDKDGETALYWASRDGRADIVATLLAQEGIDVNAKSDDDGETALIGASDEGHTKIVKMLLEKEGINVNANNNGGYTALMLASECGLGWGVMNLPWYQAEGRAARTVKMLLAEGADVNAKNNNNDTALDIAIETECQKVIKLLKQHIVAQTLPRHLERQDERKRDRENLHMLMSEKQVRKPYGKQRMHPVLERYMAYFLGGRKTRRSKKSKKSNKRRRKTRSKRKSMNAKGTRRQRLQPLRRKTRRRNMRGGGASLSRSRAPKEVTKETTPAVRPPRRVSFLEIETSRPDVLEQIEEMSVPAPPSRDNRWSCYVLPPSSDAIIDMSIARNKMRRKFEKKLKTAIREGDIDPNDPDDKAHMVCASAALENMFRNTFPDLYRR